MSTITQEQADKIKGIIDNDANLAGRYFEIKGLPERNDFENSEYMRQFGKTMAEDRFVNATGEWFTDTAAAYNEVVNKLLLPEKIKGACVVGGLAIAMAKANEDIGLFNLWRENNQGIPSVNPETIEAIETYFGLASDMLMALQGINDSFEGHSPAKKAAATRQRRKALKEQVDRFVTGEPRGYWSGDMVAYQKHLGNVS